MINDAVRERPILFSGPMVSAILKGHKTQTRRVVTRVADFSEWVTADKELVDTQAMLSRPGNAAFVNSSHCPHGKLRGQLWIREAWRVASLPVDERPAIQYRADNSIEWRDPLDSIYDWDLKYEDWFERMNLQLIEDCERAGLEVNINEEMAYTWDWDSIPTRWRPSIHMPRWASRIMLEIVSVRVEKVQGISEDDAKAEGVEPWHSPHPAIEKHNRPGGSYRNGFHDLWDSLNAKRGYGWDINPWVWVVEFRQIQLG